MTAPNWFSRQVRWLGAGRNPLARAGDRLEAWLVMFAMILALLAVPIALTVGSDVRAAAVVTAQEQRATRTQTTAVLLAAAPDTPAAEAQGPTSTPVYATWQLPNGSQRFGPIDAGAGTPAGTKVPIWIDQAGDPARPPMTALNAATLGYGAAVAVWLGVVVALCLLFSLVRLVLNRGRAAAWTREWERAGRDLNRF